MPLALAGLALGVVGTGMSIAGNAQSQSAMNAARANETAQQAKIQKASNALVQKSIAGSTPQDAAAEMAQGQNARNSAWSSLNSATAPVASALPPTSPDSPTGRAAARTSTAADAWNRLTANAAAKEGSYGDWQNQQGIKNADTSQQLAVQNNFSQGDANLLPLEMQVASQKGGALSGWGSIVSSLGALAGVAGATGAFSSAPGLPSAGALNDFNAGAGPVSNAYAATTPAWSNAAANNVWTNIYSP